MQQYLGRLHRYHPNKTEIRVYDLAGTLKVIDVTQNPILYSEDEYPKKAKTTTLYGKLKNYLEIFPADLVVIDNASDVYDANENNRAQVRGFINSLKNLGKNNNVATLLLAHVNKQTAKGDDKSTNFTGSTSWNNSVRSRWYLASVNDIVTLHHEKSNFGKKSGDIKLTWTNDGILRHITANDIQAREDNDMKILLQLIQHNYNNSSYISPASNSPHNAYNTLSRSPDFPKSIKAQKQLTPLLTRAISIGLLTTEKYKKGSNSAERYLVIEISGKPNLPT